MRESQTFGVVLIREAARSDRETFDVAHWRKSSISTSCRTVLGLSCVGGQRFRIRIRSRQADGLNLGEVDYLTVEPSVAVPARHTGSRSC